MSENPEYNPALNGMKSRTLPADREVKQARESVDMQAVYAAKPMTYKVVKRLFDIVASILALIVLSPVFLVTAIAIRMEDGGTVFFVANRYGKDLRLFPMLKFRSMVSGAEEILSTILTEKDKNGLAYKIEKDPRVTRVGRFIRRTSIDELPQLINVIRGEMSIVGPRPIGTTDKKMNHTERQRWCVQPGLTCYWQVRPERVIPWSEWVEMDLRYIKEMSILTDLKLIFMTFPALVARAKSGKEEEKQQ